MDGEDIFDLFDHCVPFELSLREALIQNLVTPFKYYGIRDELIDFSDRNPNLIKELSNKIHTDFIKSEIEKHRQKGKLKCISFCKSVEHAKMLSEALALTGYNTIALSGNNSTGERIKAFNDLQSDTQSLEIIFTIDILNEGVDIPAINMVLFLRPTESQTIFLQQLGRGLRKFENKEYLTVLDFIGNNYQRSVQIALALSSLSDTNVDKPYLRKLISTNFTSLELPIEIQLDELSKIEMLNFLEKSSFNTKKILKSDYESFKRYLKVETYPLHVDYLINDCAPNLDLFMKSSLSGKNRSYYNFLVKMDEVNIPLLTDEENNLIDNISDLVPIVRIDEIAIIEFLLDQPKSLDEIYSYDFESNRVTKETINNAIHHLLKQNIIKKDGLFFELNVSKISDNISDYLIDLIQYAKTRYQQEFGIYDTKFKYLANYYKEQVMRVLLEESLMYMQGTKYLANNEVCVFIGLKKDKSKAELLNYKDKFLNESLFQWESVKNATIHNSEGKKLLAAKKIHLFVRKVESEDGITQPFKYFGEGIFTNMRQSSTAGSSTLLFDIKLDNNVPERYHLEFNVTSEDI